MSAFDTAGKRASCKYSHLFNSNLNNFWAVEALRGICDRHNNTVSQNSLEEDRVSGIIGCPAAERPRGYCVGRIDFSPVKKPAATPHFSAVNGVPRWSKEYKTKKLFLKTLQKHFGDDGLYDHILIDLPDIKPTSKKCSKNDLETHSKKNQTAVEHAVSYSPANGPRLSNSASNQSLFDIIDISLIDTGNNVDSPQHCNSPIPNPLELRNNDAAMKHYFSFFEENCIKVEDIHRLLDFNCDEFAYRPNFLSFGFHKELKLIGKP
uniref:Uncharacterized protein n=1 Tax=Romanomermis culicivorax TaxID=13658 RepID=A0A915L8Y3_ROMCU